MKRIRVIIGKYLLLICMCFVGVSCVDAAMVDFKISGKNEIKVGEKVQLKSNYHLSNEMINPNEKVSSAPVDKDTTKESKWSIVSDSVAVDDSNNAVDVQDIAKISDDGVITGLKPGTVTVKAEYQGTIATYQVTVKARNNNGVILAICITCSLIALGTGTYIICNSKKHGNSLEKNSLFSIINLRE